MTRGEIMKHALSIIAVAMLPVLGAPTLAFATSHQTSTKPSQGGAQTEGEVRKVDKPAKKLTIRHGPIQNLDMPPMTMVFQVTDTALLDKVKAGDKIRFSAEKQGGAYVVTHVEQAQ
jgi:Cu(I)/Ag(I) efflux system protein CusF